MGTDVRKPDLVVWAQQRPRRFKAAVSQINAFVIIHSLEIIIAKLAACNMSVIWLVSVAEQTGLGLDWLETQKGFLTMRPIL